MKMTTPQNLIGQRDTVRISHYCTFLFSFVIQEPQNIFKAAPNL